MKVCITCPHLYINGGVSNYYNVMKKYLSADIIFFEIGAQRNNENIFQKIKHFVFDIIKFNTLLRESSSYDLIHLNPSLDFKALVRDGIFLLISKYYGLKTLIYIHGWSSEVQTKITLYLQPLFLKVFCYANAFVVLSKEFKCALVNWGITNPIFIETTPVDNELLYNFKIGQSVNSQIKGSSNYKGTSILFLARIVKEKGIFETINTFASLAVLYPSLSLKVAGDGPELDCAKGLVVKLNLQDRVEFLGHVSGEKKKDVFANSSLYLFPTAYGEGMPTSVLEAMAFGLPVITCPVGGIIDFFEDGKHGFLIKNHDSKEIITAVVKLLDSVDLYRNISFYNYQYAKSYFMATVVAARLKQIYSSIIEETNKIDGKKIFWR